MELDEKLRTRNPDKDDDESGDFWVTQAQPTGELWEYVIDFDNLAFWVNGAPFFCLDPLPPPEIFIDIDPKTWDRYGHYAPSLTTPTKYVVSHAVAPAPPVHALSLEAYTGLSSTEIPVLPIHDILGLQTQQTPTETIRIRLLEVLVGHLMVDDECFGWIPRAMCAYRSVACGKKQAPAKAYTAFTAFVAAIVHPPHLSLEGLSLRCDVNWPRPDVCLLLAFHLDDEPNLRASIVQLTKVVREARQSSKTPIPQQAIYGVLFDVWKCCIVKIHLDGHVVAHTGCLQFLPDFRLAENPHTPGITAIGRLFCRPGSNLFRGISHFYFKPQKLKSFSSRFPPEIVRHIASYLDELKTVISLFLVSKTWANDVEADYWNYAVVNDRYRLLRALPWDPSRNHLASATFKAFDFQTDKIVDLSISHTPKDNIDYQYPCKRIDNNPTMLDIRFSKGGGDDHLIAYKSWVWEFQQITLRIDLEETLPLELTWYESDD